MKQFEISRVQHFEIKGKKYNNRLNLTVKSAAAEC